MRMEPFTRAIVAAEAAVRASVAGNDASHDISHVERVKGTALRLAAAEGITDEETLAIIELGALLHDIHDYKYSGSDAASEDVAGALLRDCSVPGPAVLRILAVIRGTSFSGEITTSNDTEIALPPEVAIVQDADRLDAIGAIGIARCLTFGGAKQRVLHDPLIPPVVATTMSKDAYRATKSSTINHFYEKLLLLKDRMKTKSGRLAAIQRHDFMVAWLQQFNQEWDGVL